jgi:NAD(P)-dependent dehydrogenase (short-subunit alcohol dehydrogenase family)
MTEHHCAHGGDVSKAAASHLIRDLAVSLAPRVRVNVINPAAVVQDSTMFPRDRVLASLKKYGIAFRDEQPDDELRSLLAIFSSLAVCVLRFRS